MTNTLERLCTFISLFLPPPPNFPFPFFFFFPGVAFDNVDFQLCCRQKFGAILWL